MNAIDGVPSTPKKIVVFRVEVAHPETGEALADFGFALADINLPNWPNRSWEVREIEVPEDAELEVFGALLIDRGGSKLRFSPRELFEEFAEPGSLDRHIKIYVSEIQPVESAMVAMGFPPWSDHTEALARQFAAARKALEKPAAAPVPSPTRPPSRAAKSLF